MSDIVWAIDARKDQLGELIDRIKEVAFSAMEIGNFYIHFDLQNIDPKREITSNVRQNLYLIFKEAINNIVKHSNATKANVLIYLTGGQLNLIISDNGRGLPENNSFSGNGLKNMQLRTQRIKGIFKTENKNGFTLSVKNVKV